MDLFEALRRPVETYGSQIALIVAGVAVLSMPVAAVHDSVPCPIPPELLPLFELLHTFAELAMVLGILIGTLGILIAGIMWMIPGPDWNRRAKGTATYVVVGTVILLSAHMIMAFLISQMGGTFC